MNMAALSCSSSCSALPAAALSLAGAVGALRGGGGAALVVELGADGVEPVGAAKAALEARRGGGETNDADDAVVMMPYGAWPLLLCAAIGAGESKALAAAAGKLTCTGGAAARASAAVCTRAAHALCVRVWACFQNALRDANVRRALPVAARGRGVAVVAVAAALVAAVAAALVAAVACCCDGRSPGWLLLRPCAH